MKIQNILPLIFLLTALNMAAQDYTEINREELLELTGKVNDTTYVINFWATWCSPCVKEIVFFEDLYRENQREKLKVVLVSLDFPNRAKTQLLPFLNEKSITAPVLLMTNMDYNSWIEEVDPDWSGAIPATLFHKGGKRMFLEGEISREELYEYVNQISE